jgi:hypothetical protein
MASITIRDIDERFKARLRCRQPTMAAPWRRRHATFFGRRCQPDAREADLSWIPFVLALSRWGALSWKLRLARLYVSR